jgi:hypothetical protein
MISVSKIIVEIQDQVKRMKLIHNCDQFLKNLYGKNDKNVIRVELNEEVWWFQKKGHSVSLSHCFEDYINEEECWE